MPINPLCLNTLLFLLIGLQANYSSFAFLASPLTISARERDDQTLSYGCLESAASFNLTWLTGPNRTRCGGPALPAITKLCLRCALFCLHRCRVAANNTKAYSQPMVSTRRTVPYYGHLQCGPEAVFQEYDQGCPWESTKSLAPSSKSNLPPVFIGMGRRAADLACVGIPLFITIPTNVSFETVPFRDTHTGKTPGRVI